MILLKTISVVLHIIFAAAWFGMGLRLATQARTALALDSPAGIALADDALRTVRFMSIFIVLTLLFAYTSLGLGIAIGISYNWPFHVAGVLILVLVLVQFLLLNPAWQRLRAALADPRDPADAENARKRIAMSMGIGHLCWFLLLILMFWDQFVAAAGTM